MAKIYRPKRGHRATRQIDHRDVVGIDVLVHHHLAPLGVQGQVAVPGDSKQAPPVLQIAVVDHRAAGLSVRAQLAGLAVVVTEVSDKVVPQRADVSIVNRLRPRHATHIALGDHLVCLQVVD